MRIPHTPSRAALAAALAILLALLPSWARAASVLAPHHARYELALHPNSRGSDVVAVKGMLEVRFERSCDGWRMDQSLGFRMLTQDGDGLEHLAHLTGFEELDGSGFVFSTRTWEDRRLIEELAGVARRDRSTGEVAVRYSMPETRRETLPRGTLFPGQHVEQVLSAARADKRSVLATVFDGSTADNPYEISTWIGRPRASAADAPPALSGRTAWPVRLAYFGVAAKEPRPEFEMSVLLYDNGVAGDMVYDYGDFAIDVRLEQVQLLPVPGCR